MDSPNATQPCTSVCIDEMGETVELRIDNGCEEYGEWIEDEGGDVCLLRERESGRVIGVCLPLKVNLWQLEGKWQ